jgi:hypothetical protein
VIGDQESYGSTTPEIIHTFSFDPSERLLTGATLTLNFRGVAANGSTGYTSHAKLRNLTDSDDISTLNFSTMSMVLQTSVLTIGSGAGEIKNAARIYEVHIWVEAPLGPLSTIELGSVELMVINTIV